MSYAAHLKMHFNFGERGGSRISELTDYPGVLVQDDYLKKENRTVRKITFKEREFKTLEGAIAAWKDSNDSARI